MGESNPYGYWTIDNAGFPVFQYTSKEYSDSSAHYYTTYGGSNTHYHLIGNEAWSLLATNHGNIIGLDSRRALTLIGNSGWEPNPDHKGLGFCVIRDNEGNILTDLNNPHDEILDIRTFGSGYFQKSFTRNGITVQNTIFAPPSKNALMLSEITIESARTNPIEIQVCSCWDFYHYPLQKSAIVSSHGRKDYFLDPLKNWVMKFLVKLQKLLRMDTDGARLKHARRIALHTEKTDSGQLIFVPTYKSLRNRDPAKPSDINYHYKPIFLECLESPQHVEIGYVQNKDIWNSDFQTQNFHNRKFRNGEVCLIAKSSIKITKSQPVKLLFLFGIENREKIGDIITHFKTQIRENGPKAPFNEMIATIKRQSLDFNIPGIPWFKREVQWHSAYLLASMFTDEYYNYPRIPQGSIYLLGHGFDGSVRDYCMYLFPLIFLNPKLARENLKFIFSLIEPSGKIPYSFHGYGKTVSIPGIHANPSDQYFFVIWALSEYVFLTRDFEFLQESLVASDYTIVEILRKLINYVLSENIGLGKHDMVRVRDGDWNDGITFMVNNRKKFIQKGESAFNSAMLVFSFKQILPLIEILDASIAKRMESVVSRVSKAINESWSGKWFYRGWDGVENPIGSESLFLEHHVWLMVNEHFHGDHLDTAFSNIWDRLVLPAGIGAHCLDPPSSQNLLFPKGWDINGGVWHALNWLLLWGIREQSPELASEFLERMSMHTRSDLYPNIWYGIWSGPDAYNSKISLRPGEAFFHVSTPMCDFPFMNNNLHCGMLAAVIKFAGIKGNYHGITIDLCIAQEFSFSSALISVDKRNDEIEIRLGSHFRTNFTLNVVIPSNFSDTPEIIISPPPISEFKMYHNVLQLIYLRDKPIKKIVIKKDFLDGEFI
jgi:hypothetical protein